jgi:hypothetical protein
MITMADSTVRSGRTWTSSPDAQHPPALLPMAGVPIAAGGVCFGRAAEVGAQMWSGLSLLLED